MMDGSKGKGRYQVVIVVLAGFDFRWGDGGGACV